MLSHDSRGQRQATAASPVVTVPDGARVWQPSADTDLAVNYAAGILSKPLVASSTALGSILGDLRTVDRRISSLFTDSIDDPDFRQHTLGLNPVQARVVQECLRIERDLGIRDHYDREPLVRADLLVGESGPALIELNYTSACGGFDEELVFDTFLDPTADPNLDEKSHANILDALVRQLLAFSGPKPGTVALVDSVSSYKTYRPRLTILARLLKERGIQALHTDVDSVRAAADGSLVHGPSGSRIDTVWRFFMLDEIETLRDAEGISTILGAWARGRCTLFGSLVEEAKSSKALLATLANDAATVLNDPGLVPPASMIGGMISSGSGIHRDRMAVTLAEALDNPNDWVLKTPFGHGGYGVVVGDQVPPQIWRHKLGRAATGYAPAVLQRRIDETLFSLSDGDAVSLQARLNLGLFLAARDAHPLVDYYGGCFLRLGPDETEKIGLSLGSLTASLLVNDNSEDNE